MEETAWPFSSQILNCFFTESFLRDTIWKSFLSLSLNLQLSTSALHVYERSDLAEVCILSQVTAVAHRDLLHQPKFLFFKKILTTFGWKPKTIIFSICFPVYFCRRKIFLDNILSTLKALSFVLFYPKYVSVSSFVVFAMTSRSPTTTQVLTFS